ncbi:MAG: hypothetical protein QXP31_06015 [Pyrobaculum sp.]
MGLSAEEKRRFLKALEEDEEFRLAVAGLLGLGEVIQELRRLREDFDKWVKKTDKWWRQNEKRWKEEEKRWKTWYETWQKFLEDYQMRWKEQADKWEEAKKRFARIEAALGDLTEAFFSKSALEYIQLEAKSAGEEVLRVERNADFNGVDVDLLVETEKRVYVVEVKTRPKPQDVGALLAKAEIVERALGKPAAPILAGTRIGKEVETYAKGKGVKVYKI